jgi:hypothetical protein
LLNSINPNTQIIIGGDINACTGTRTCDEQKQVLGPYGIPRSNARGENLLHVLAAYNLRIKNTFFNHQEEEYTTYTSIPMDHHPKGVPSMHDIFASSQLLHKRIHYCRMVLHGVASDHRAVRLKVALSSVKFKASAMSRGTINWPKILTNEHTQMVYNEHLLSLTTLGIEYNDYQEIILKAGMLTATHHKRQCKGWFQMSQAVLAPFLKEHNKVLHATNQCHHLPAAIQSTMRADLKHLNRHITHAVSYAKATWYADVCKKLHDMQMELRLAWEHIHLLTKGKSAHHQH